MRNYRHAAPMTGSAWNCLNIYWLRQPILWRHSY